MRHQALWISLAALTFAACGGSDDAADPAPTEDEAAESDTDQPEPEPEPDSEPEPATGTEPEPAGPSEIASGDGRLVLSLPADAPDVTIAEAAPLEVPEVEAGLAASLGDYELGPGGATFNPPLAVEFTVPDTADVAADGFAVIHVLDDGTMESIVPEFTETGLRFELDSFSSVHLLHVPQRAAAVELSAPGQAMVGENFSASIDVVGITDVMNAVATVGEVSMDDVTASGAVADAGQYLWFNCTTGGGGSVGYVGPLTVELVESRTYHFPEVRGEVAVTCVAGTPVEPTDVRFIDRTTGNTVEPFLTGEQLTPTVAVDRENSTFTISFDVPADATTAVGTGGPTSDGSFRYLEVDLDTTTGFFGNGFANFDPDPGFATAERTDLGDGMARDSFTISVPCGIDGMYRVLPGGTPADGSAPIEPIDVMIADLTGFVETPDGQQAIIFLDPVGGPIADVEGFATCP